MKKILFLLLFSLIKLSAYDYLIYYRNQPSYATSYFMGENGNLYSIFYYNDGRTQKQTISKDSWNTYYNFFSGIRRSNLTLDQLEKYNSSGSAYIGKSIFNSYFKNDKLFLNDLYKYFGNVFLNYLYNSDSNFSYQNHINYDNYELLYNSDGLIVESIVGGKWAGLFDDSGQSGKLYNEKGDLLYVNGESPSFFEKINEKLLKRFKINLESIFIKNIFYPLLVLIFACVIFRSVIRMAFKAFLIRFYNKKIGQLEKRRENIENA